MEISEQENKRYVLYIPAESDSKNSRAVPLLFSDSYQDIVDQIDAHFGEEELLIMDRFHKKNSSMPPTWSSKIYNVHNFVNIPRSL